MLENPQRARGLPIRESIKCPKALPSQSPYIINPRVRRESWHRSMFSLGFCRTQAAQGLGQTVETKAVGAWVFSLFVVGGAGSIS